MVGRHNVLNALSVIALADEMGIPTEVTRAALASFEGVQRRFTVRGEAGGVTVVDDYGHHPAEVRATLLGAREAYRRRVVCLFQPHRYSRTRDLHERLRHRLQRRRRAPPHGHLRGRRGAAAGGHPGGARRRHPGLRPQGRPLGRAAPAWPRRPGSGCAPGTSSSPWAPATSPRRAPSSSASWGPEPVADWRLELGRRLRGEVLLDERLAPRTTIKVGGPAELLARPADLDDLVALLRAAAELGAPLSVLGGGANTLVADAGVEGVVLRLPPDLAEERVEGELVTLPAGAPIARLMARAHAHGLTGAEFSVGIPGTLGGAVAMNAGTRQGEMKDVLARVELATAERRRVRAGRRPRARLPPQRARPPARWSPAWRCASRPATWRPAAPPWRPTWRGGGPASRSPSRPSAPPSPTRRATTPAGSSRRWG